jgi:hypothetical protein
MLMPTSNHWLVPNRVIYSHPNSIVTLEELSKANTEIIQMLRQAYAITNQPVHLIIDSSNVAKQPSPLDTRRVFTYMKEPSLGWTMIGGIGNPMLYFFTRMVSSLVMSRTIICETPAHALEMLQFKDPTLSDLVTLYREMKDSGAL